MARPAEPVDRAHRSAPVPVLPSALLAALCPAAAHGGPLAGSAARLLAPQLRGRVSSRTLASFRRSGLTVHRVGAAAYVHGLGFHWILAVADRGEPDPFPGRLGRAPSGLSWDRLAAVWRAPRQAPWYPEAGSALEARSMDGDR